MTNEKKNIPETTEAMPLTDDQLEDVTGGAGPTIRLITFSNLRCAADTRHIWPSGAKVCPICGSKRFVRSGAWG